MNLINRVTPRSDYSAMEEAEAALWNGVYKQQVRERNESIRKEVCGE